MAEIIAVDDLPEDMRSKDLVAEMVAGANAKASRVAPCLDSTDPPPSDGQLAEAKLILLGAVKRWTEAGAGSFQQQTAGPFSMSTDTRQRSGYNLWPSEIEALHGLHRRVPPHHPGGGQAGGGASGRRDPERSPRAGGDHRPLLPRHHRPLASRLQAPRPRRPEPWGAHPGKTEGESGSRRWAAWNP